jgi:hypothetical protein
MSTTENSTNLTSTSKGHIFLILGIFISIILITVLIFSIFYSITVDNDLKLTEISNTSCLSGGEIKTYQYFRADAKWKAYIYFKESQKIFLGRSESGEALTEPFTEFLSFKNNFLTKEDFKNSRIDYSLVNNNYKDFTLVINSDHVSKENYQELDSCIKDLPISVKNTIYKQI